MHCQGILGTCIAADPIVQFLTKPEGGSAWGGNKMGLHSEEYQRLVLDDLKNLEGLSHPVKASLPERLFVRKTSTDNLHPNPKDEFSDPKIGPNYEIVSNYANGYRYAMKSHDDPFDNQDPLQVTKVSGGGYMLLNGHHRWMAAERVGLDPMKIHIVNIPSDDDVISKINSSDKKVCVSFDLDEVLLTDGKRCPAAPNFIFPFNLIYKKRLRKNAHLLINELRRMGFEVWVYTGEFYSDDYVNFMFKLCGTKIDGVVCGSKRQKNDHRVSRAFTEKFDVSVQIFNQMISVVNNRTKEFNVEQIPESGSAWASSAITTLKKMAFSAG